MYELHFMKEPHFRKRSNSYYNDRILFMYYIPHHTRIRLIAASPATMVQ